MRSELVLSEALEDLRGYDFVLLDTAPSWDVLNVNCLFYVDELLIPVSMEALALQGIGDFLGRVDQVQRYRDGLRVLSIIPTFYDRRVRKSAEILEQLKRYFPNALWPCVRYNSKLSEAPGLASTSSSTRKGATGPPTTPVWPSGSRKGRERGHGQDKESAGRPHGNHPERDRRVSRRRTGFSGVHRSSYGHACCGRRRRNLLGGSALAGGYHVQPLQTGRQRVG